MTTQHTAPLASSPGEPGYTDAIAAFNLLPSITPARTVVARSALDAQAAIRYATERGRPVSVITTGHSLGSSQPLDGALLVRTAFEATVRVDPLRRTAQIPAGATWADVVAAATPHGLVALHGSSGTVGAIGYLLRGGLSFYGREFGIAANSITSITIALADSSIVTASATSDAELFWALRGGGGGFGIVLEIEIELRPMWKVLTGITIWDSTHAADIIPRWLDWAKTAPPEISTSLRVLNLPPLPGIPPMLQGRQVIAIDGSVSIVGPNLLGQSVSIADELLAPLRASAEPILDTWDAVEPDALLLTHMDPPEPLPYIGDHFLVSGVDEADVTALLALIGPGSDSMLSAVEFRQLGGAIAEPSAAGGAFDRTGAEHAFLVVAAIGGPATVEAQHATMAAARAALSHRDTGYTAPTFVESTDQPSRTFDDYTAARVESIRSRVDPTGLFSLMVSRANR
ncbi:FAD-binding oxidoreductase [Glaciihabitans arcticus]|nr:FAD-dependent oxidoreductase [Glaciihabitans arcticus]